MQLKQSAGLAIDSKSLGKETIIVRLFLREHFVLIIVQLIQFMTIVGMFWLSGFRNVHLALYSIFLSCFFLCCYLTYTYIRHRKFYNRLSHPVKTLDETLQELDDVAMSKALTKLLTSQYNEFQKQLFEMNQRQEQHMSFIDRWIHQMKTPISVIELMAKDLDEPESSSFREEIDRMKTGLNMVLYMSRLRTIEQDFHIKRVYLNKLVKEVNQDNKRLFIRNNVFPQVIEEKKELTIESDEKWLFFMITQLVHNAVKYSAGQANIIQITLFEKNGLKIFEIKDFGIGIPEEDQKRIFDAFYTGENGRKYRESTGVGLFLTNEVANYLGHRLEVESSVGKGSTFRITFN